MLTLIHDTDSKYYVIVDFEDKLVLTEWRPSVYETLQNVTGYTAMPQHSAFHQGTNYVTILEFETVGQLKQDNPELFI